MTPEGPPPWHVVVVPDGLAAQDGKALAEPSFVYRAVLDAALTRPHSDVIVLAPANAFGGPLTEEEAAERYLRAQGWTGAILRQPRVEGDYVDTRGNARHLRVWLQARGVWPLPQALLLVAKRHARRARLCFAREGFRFAAVQPVPYAVPAAEAVVPRLWYYRYPAIHGLYEGLALVRDRLRPATH